MGILSNTVSICQFRVVGDPPTTDLFEWASENLGKHGFRSIDNGLEEVSTGWVHTGNQQESSFAVPADFWHDHYMAFTLRQDRRRIPASLLKARLKAAENEFLAEHPGYSRVPKQKREEIYEGVKTRLLAKILPVPSCHDAVWDMRNGIVTFTSLGRATLETFEEQFKKSFPGLRLSTIHPFARAQIIAEGEMKSALASANRASSEAALDMIVSNRWIGCDFLLWLMFRTLNGSSEYSVCRPGPEGQGTPFIAYINDRVVLRGTGDSIQKVTVAGPQERFSEVCTALSGGKVINEASMHFEMGDDRWKLTLKGEMFHFASLKTPRVKEEKDNGVDRTSELESLFFERTYLLEKGVQLFDSLFSSFLSVRLSPHWNGEVAKIGEWLKED